MVNHTAIALHVPTEVAQAIAQPATEITQSSVTTGANSSIPYEIQYSDSINSNVTLNTFPGSSNSQKCADANSTVSATKYEVRPTVYCLEVQILKT
jgi:hypothetical protein